MTFEILELKQTVVDVIQLSFQIITLIDFVSVIPIA